MRRECCRRDLLAHPDATPYARRGVAEAADEGAVRAESMAWVNSGEVTYAHPERLDAELETFGAGIAGQSVVGGFVPATSRSIDTCAMHVEDPEVVAQRIERYASVVGRERIIAGADCGFGTPAGQDNLRPSVVWSKLASLSEGARLASRRRCSPTVNLRLD